MGSNPRDSGTDPGGIGSNDAPDASITSRVDLVTAALRDAILDGRLRPGRAHQPGGRRRGSRHQPRARPRGVPAARERGARSSSSRAAAPGSRSWRSTSTPRSTGSASGSNRRRVAASVPHLTDAQVAELGSLVEAMEAASEPIVWLDLDRRLPPAQLRRCAAAAPAAHDRGLLEHDRSSTAACTSTTSAESGDLSQVHAEHRLLLSAIVRKRRRRRRGAAAHRTSAARATTWPARRSCSTSDRAAPRSGAGAARWRPTRRTSGTRSRARRRTTRAA